MKLQLIRSATMRITYNNHNFLTDPYLAEKLSLPSYAGKSKNPLVDLLFPIEQILNDIEMALVSHIHSDHFDTAAHEILPKRMPLLCQAEDRPRIVNLGFKLVYPISEMCKWNGIRIERIQGKHGSGDVLTQMGMASGFFFQADGEPSVYWAGDTILCDEVKEAIITRKPDIIITHSCGAEWGNHVKILMDDVQTVEVCHLAPQSKIVAVHMDSVDHATVSRKDLREYADKCGIKKEQLLIPADGETLYFPFLTTEIINSNKGMNN